MIRSQTIALHCAAVMQKTFPRLLCGHKSGTVRDCKALGIKRYQDSLALLRQLDACRSDEARRLIMGTSR